MKGEEERGGEVEIRGEEKKRTVAMVCAWSHKAGRKEEK